MPDLKPAVPVVLCLVLLSALRPGLAQQLSFTNIRGVLTTDVVAGDSLALLFQEEAIDSGDPEQLIQSEYLLGLSNYYLGRIFSSTQHYERLVAQLDPVEKPELCSSVWNNLGINYEYLQKYPEALAAYQKSYTLAEQLGDSLSMAQSWLNFGLLDIKNKHFSSALAYFDRAEHYFTRSLDSLNLGLTLQNRGVVHKELGDWEALAAASTSALVIFRAIDYQHGVAQCLINIGYARIEQQQYRIARSLLDEAVALSKQEGFYLSEAYAKSSLGRLFMEQNRYQEAISMFQQVDDLSRDNGFLELVGGNYHSLLQAIAKTNNYSYYDEVLNDYTAFLDEQDLATAKARYAELKTVYEYERHLRELEEQRQKLQTQRFRIYGLLLFSMLMLAALLLIGRLWYNGKRLQKGIFLKNQELLAQVQRFREQEQEKKKSAGERLSKLESLFLSIESYMEAEKPYRDSDLSLATLSQQLGSNDSYVSRAINQFSGVNFNQYVNDLRVKAAEQLLASQAGPTIKEVAMVCGFNSYSTFHRLFKQKTGLTPSQYREQAEG